MALTKTTGKPLLRKGIVLLLFVANIAAFAITNRFFSTRATTADKEGKKDLVSRLYTGWQMLDRSFSLIDYFRNVGDRKN